MVDHLIIQVAPVLLGEGIPLFTQAEALHRFKLEAVNRYGQFAELVFAGVSSPRRSSRRRLTAWSALRFPICANTRLST